MASEIHRFVSLLLQPNSDWSGRPSISPIVGYIGVASGYPQIAAANGSINMPDCAQSLPVFIVAYDNGFGDTNTGERQAMQRTGAGVQAGVQQDPMTNGLCNIELSTFNKQIVEFMGIGKPRLHSRPSGLPPHQIQARQWPPYRPRPGRIDGGGTTAIS